MSFAKAAFTCIVLAFLSAVPASAAGACSLLTSGGNRVGLGR